MPVESTVIFPELTVRLPICVLIYSVSLDDVAPLIEPPVMLAVTLITFRLFRLAALKSVPPETGATLADPTVRLAVPLPIVRLPSVALAVNVPKLTLERPVTVAPVCVPIVASHVAIWLKSG